jgi:hypothetical protein
MNTNEIATSESARFLATFEASDKDGLNNVDLSGSPSLRKTINDKFEPHDKDGLNNVDVSGLPSTNQLKQFLTAPDVDSLQRVGEELRDPNLLAEVRDQQEEAEAVAFVHAHPEYQRDDGNLEKIQSWLSQRGLQFRRDNIAKAFRALVRSGEMQAIGAARNLTESQKLTVMASAKAGRIDDAITLYLDFAFPDADERWADAAEFLSDVDTLSVRNEATAFVHYHSRPIQDSPDWEKFKRTYFKRRPMVTLADLDQCWDAFQKQDDLAQRDRLFSAPTETPPTATELNALDDEHVDRLYHASLRHYAQTAKKSAGIIA